MESETDFKVFYFDNYRKFFLVVTILVVLAVLQEVVLVNTPLLVQLPKLLIPLTLSLLAFTKNRNEIIHKIIVIVLLVVFIGSLAVEDYTIK